uniref:Uncharacterized protein n=1 Tax=Ditylenchus dipsaci TaxID=166011 RepID=A0A915DW73_9BILA
MEEGDCDLIATIEENSAVFIVQAVGGNGDLEATIEENSAVFIVQAVGGNGDLEATIEKNLADFDKKENLAAFDVQAREEDGGLEAGNKEILQLSVFKLKEVMVVRKLRMRLDSVNYIDEVEDSDCVIIVNLKERALQILWNTKMRLQRIVEFQLSEAGKYSHSAKDELACEMAQIAKDEKEPVFTVQSLRRQ